MKRFNRPAWMMASLMAGIVFVHGCGGGGGGGAPADGGGGGDAPAGDPSTVVNNVEIPPGPQCPNGGVQIDFGIDENGNGVLDPAEVDGSEVICFATADLTRLDGPIYLADGEFDDLIEIYRSRLDGLGAVNLAPQAFINADIVNFQVSPDGRWVAYRADQERDNLFDLYVIDLGTGRIIKASGTMQPLGNVGEFQWAPDSSRIAYRADQTTDEVFELFVTTLVGAAGNFRVSGPLVTGGAVFQFQWAPDSSRIAYLAHQNTVGVSELYTVLPNRSNNLKVSGAMVPGGSVQRDFLWAPDSTHIAYRADQDTDNVFELYTAQPAVAASGIKVSGTMVAGGAVFVGFQWAPDSSRIAYRADQTIDNVDELYTVLPDGFGNFRVSGTMVAGGAVFGFRWAPDSSRIAYSADQTTDQVFELYTVLPATAASGVKVSGAMVLNGGVQGGFQWAPDSSRIAYQADQTTENVVELYTVLPNGGGNLKVSGAMVLNGDVLDFQWAPDSSRIAYRADQTTDNVDDLYTVLPDGASNLKVSGTMVLNGNVQFGFQWAWAPDSSRIAYRAAQDTANDELYTVLPGGGSNLKISGPLVSGGDVLSFQWVP